MPKTYVSPFPQNSKTATAIATNAIALTGANSVATSTPNETVLLLTAGAEGALLTRLTAMPRGTVTATSLLLFIRKATDAANVRTLVDGALMAAYTFNGTTLPPVANFALYNEGTPYRLQPGDELYVGITVALAAGVAFRAEYSEF